MHSYATLTQQARALGLRAGDVVMLHASLRKVGPICGGPDVLIASLRDCVTPGGALVMYVGCPGGFDEIGRPRTGAGDAAVLRANLPVFEPEHARADYQMGSLVELFRTYPGAVCSRHISARVAALGEAAQEIIADQPLDYGFGPEGPLKVVAQRGKVLLLGSDQDEVTLLHFAEAVCAIPHARKRTVVYETRLSTGWIKVEEYDTSEGILGWPDRYFEQIMHAFYRARPEAYAQGIVGDAPSWLVDARALVQFARDKMVADAASLRLIASESAGP